MTDDTLRRFHDKWLGMAQPYEGLVVSAAVLEDKQVLERQGREVQEQLLACTAVDGNGKRYAPNLVLLFEQVLGLDASRFDVGEALPKALRLYVPEGKQELRPTMALRAPKDQRHSSPAGCVGAADGEANLEGGVGTPLGGTAELSPAAQAGQGYLALVWDVPFEVELDKPETVTGPWEYPTLAKFDRLLRECRVPIGLLSNGREVRLVYAPHGESTGWLAFRLEAMTAVGGREVLDAFVMLLGKHRWFSVAEDVQLPALLAQSRRQQANVTNALREQVLSALEELLNGFAAASERDGEGQLRRAMEADDGSVYSGLLTLLLRLVFTLYCEDKSLLPVDKDLYAQNYSVLGLYDQLERDNGRYPDSMDRRYGAYGRLLTLFRAIYLGVTHGDFHLPPRHGDLFDPNRYPFLEGWGAGSAPVDSEARAKVAVPAISDGTVYRVLKQLIVLRSQRVSYRSLDVEQLGSVYEGLMGYDVERLAASGAVRLKLGGKSNSARVWVEAAPLLAVAPPRRAKWLEDELGFDKKVAAKIAEAVASVTTTSAADCETALLALEGLAGKKPERVARGALVIQPGPERRRTSSHYTPRSLCEPIVQKAIDPLLKAMGDAPSSEALLNLVICDPAMGSGAFLVAACRYLADQVVAAWTREAANTTAALPGIGQRPVGSSKTKLQLLTDAHEDVVNHARRLVAQRCLYGVDKNRYAVQLARLSLWLVTMAKDEPFTFVDHALRHGDSLVGLNFEQIRAFHWKTERGANVETASVALKQALDEAIGIRKQILELAEDGSASAQREKEQLLGDALDAVGRVRLIADLVVGAFFAHGKDTDREMERTRRLDLVTAWLNAPDLEQEQKLEAQLRQMQAELLASQTPFHWMLEFPEVFYLDRPDPLDGGKVNGKAMVEAVVGNPPFLGGSAVSSNFGDAYRDWLLEIHPESHGNADLSAHFFRRGATLLGNHGTLGLIATNTIGQGDTRTTGLQYLVEGGHSVVHADTDVPWPGDAAVTVSIVHLAIGKPALGQVRTLNGKPVTVVSSQLRSSIERTDPATLRSNESRSFLGSKVYGQGFVLTPAERQQLVENNPANAECIFPYLGGEEVNSSPTQSFERYVISFGQMELEEAERWPDLIEIVREKVKPERDKLKDNADGKRRKAYWWQYGRWTPALYAAIAPLSRCLVNSLHSKHLVLAWQPTDRIFSHALNVFALEATTPFAVLQSRVHEFWARLLSSSMKTDLRYAASDCFETFPFPAGEPRAVIPELEALGEALYSARAAYMVETDQGLTKTYNALKDPHNTDPRIVELRRLHEEMDRAVLRAYPQLPAGKSTEPQLGGVGDPAAIGWSDIVVPPYCIATDEDKKALTAFQDQVIDRLFLLNALRAKNEAALGQASGKGKSGKAKQAPAKAGKGGTKTTSAKGRAKLSATPGADSQGEHSSDAASSGAAESSAEGTSTPKRRGRKLASGQTAALAEDEADPADGGNPSEPAPFALTPTEGKPKGRGRKKNAAAAPSDDPLVTSDEG